MTLLTKLFKKNSTQYPKNSRLEHLNSLYLEIENFLKDLKLNLDTYVSERKSNKEIEDYLFDATMYDIQNIQYYYNDFVAYKSFIEYYEIPEEIKTVNKINLELNREFLKLFSIIKDLKTNDLTHKTIKHRMVIAFKIENQVDKTSYEI